jgi:hypothetical protein
MHGGERSAQGSGRERSAHGLDHSARSSRAEGSQHGDTAAFKGMTLAAMNAVRQERSVRGGDRSMRALSRVGSGMLSDRSMRSASQ